MDKGRTAERFRTRPVEEVVVLICGHANRDMRCGVMGPLLEREFRDKLSRKGFKEPGGPARDGGHHSRGRLARVGLVSHVGGHAFAGNVIIYIPAAKGFEGNHSAVEASGMAAWGLGTSRG